MCSLIVLKPETRWKPEQNRTTDANTKMIKTMMKMVNTVTTGGGNRGGWGTTKGAVRETTIHNIIMIRKENKPYSYYSAMITTVGTVDSAWTTSVQHACQWVKDLEMRSPSRLSSTQHYYNYRCPINGWADAKTLQYPTCLLYVISIVQSCTVHHP